MIPFALENHITGETLFAYSDYELSDLESLPLKTRKKFLYQRSMLKVGKFGEKSEEIFGNLSLHFQFEKVSAAAFEKVNVLNIVHLF